jgi:hypothetical protein
VVNGLALTCKLPVWHSWQGPETTTNAYGKCCKPAHTVHVVNYFNFYFNNDLLFIFDQARESTRSDFATIVSYMWIVLITIISIPNGSPPNHSQNDRHPPGRRLNGKEANSFRAVICKAQRNVKRDIFMLLVFTDFFIDKLPYVVQHESGEI